MKPLDPHVWAEMVDTICRKGQQQLLWAYTEPWLQAEMFADLHARRESTGWEPLSVEVPYVTFVPFTPPRTAHRDWRTSGAVKWVDLCLRSHTTNEWVWIELKSRHAGTDGREASAGRQARNAVRKDIAALAALDPAKTADTWLVPDWYTRAYWFEATLAPFAEALREGTHYYVAVYLQLDGELSEEVWSSAVMEDLVYQWWRTRTRDVESPPPYKGAHRIERFEVADANHVLVATGTL